MIQYTSRRRVPERIVCRAANSIKRERRIEHVDYDARTDDISITFHPTGIKPLAAELAGKQENAA
ncbi:MAG: hypothetical protein ACKV0T_17920 [Planctomycetales bacterium]